MTSLAIGQPRGEKLVERLERKRLAMIPGIDPTVDLAFKKVFGSETRRNLTRSLIDAVLQPAPWQRIVELELLNPYTEKTVLDDKLSILDIRARDDKGRLFNVEMQMVATASLPDRFLYYWARLYSQQLSEGDDYKSLCPTISILFLNDVIFRKSVEYHDCWQLRNRVGRSILTDNLEIHTIEIPKFAGGLDELKEPLDFWLYFLKNGIGLDADALPNPLRRSEIHEAMEVLKMLSQNEVEREIYEGRLKARLDAQTFQNMYAQVQQQSAEIGEARAELQRLRTELEEKLVKAQDELVKAQEERVRAEEDRAKAREELAKAREDRARGRRGPGKT